MKANELMIDDWVTVIADDKLFPSKYVGKSIPCKVEGFSYEPIVQPSYTEKGIGIDLKPQIGLMVRVANNFGYMYFEAEKLSPIPLTSEILEKNGLKKFNFRGIEGQHEWTWWNNTLTNVSLWCRELNDNIKDGWMIRIESPTSSLCVKVEFLHQLQHALRLCEINKEITL